MRFPHEATLVWKFWYVVAIIIKPFFLRLEIEGEEYVPLHGGCVVASNHTLGPDYVILGYASPRQIYYMAKAEIFAYHPWVASVVSGLGAFPVSSSQDVQQMTTTIMLALAELLPVERRGYYADASRLAAEDRWSGHTGSIALESAPELTAPIENG